MILDLYLSGGFESGCLVVGISVSTISPLAIGVASSSKNVSALDNSGRTISPGINNLQKIC